MDQNIDQQISAAGSDIKAQLRSGMENLEHGIDAGKQKLADAMDRSSETLRTGSRAIESQATNAADKLSLGADYLRRTPSRGLFADCGALLEKYPYHAVAAAAAAGVLLGRSLWRTDE